MNSWISLLMAGVFAVLPTGFAAAAGVAAGSPNVTPHAVVAFLHVVLVVFWLGPDVAVYICGGAAMNAKVSAATRLAAARMMVIIDLMPRVCATLMLTVGGILTAMVGVEHPPLQMAAIVLLGPVWLGAVLFGYFRYGTELGATVDKLDTWFRVFLIAAIIASVAYATSTGRLAPAPYVGPKLLLFAAVIFLGLLIRARMRPLVEAVRRTQSGADPAAADDSAVVASVGRAGPYFFAVWACLLLAAFLGVVRLGAPPESVAAGPRRPIPTLVTDQPNASPWHASVPLRPGTVPATTGQRGSVARSSFAASAVSDTSS